MSDEHPSPTNPQTAEQRADEWRKSHYQDLLCDWERKDPVRLPGGWRICYEASINHRRIQNRMIILFVADDPTSPVITDWDDFAADSKIKAALEESRSRSIDVREGIFDMAYSNVINAYPGAAIESYEAVWNADVPGQNGSLFWRFIIRQGLSRYSVLVSSEGQICNQKPKSTYVGMDSWSMGPIAFSDNGQLTVDLHATVSVRDLHYTNWKVWSCMHTATAFLEALDFNEIGPHNLHIQYLQTDNPKLGATFNYPQGIPLISFARSLKWANNLGVVLHEIGHAVLYIHNTRPIAHLNLADNHVNKTIQGISEGFADFFAATLCSSAAFATSFLFGDHLEQSKDSGLPRCVSAKPYRVEKNLANLSMALLSSLEIHEIGAAWSCILWDFCARAVEIFPKQIHRTVLTCHIRPSSNLQYPNVFGAYFQSLKESASSYIPPTAALWDQISTTHGIMFLE